MSVTRASVDAMINVHSLLIFVPRVPSNISYVMYIAYVYNNARTTLFALDTIHRAKITTILKSENFSKSFL